MSINRVLKAVLVSAITWDLAESCVPSQEWAGEGLYCVGGQNIQYCYNAYSPGTVSEVCASGCSVSPPGIPDRCNSNSNINGYSNNNVNGNSNTYSNTHSNNPTNNVQQSAFGIVIPQYPGPNSNSPEYVPPPQTFPGVGGGGGYVGGISEYDRGYRTGYDEGYQAGLQAGQGWQITTQAPPQNNYPAPPPPPPPPSNTNNQNYMNSNMSPYGNQPQFGSSLEDKYKPVYTYGPIAGSSATDDGWGCTYRDIQTIFSRLSGGQSISIPEILTALNSRGTTVDEYTKISRPFRQGDWLEPQDVQFLLSNKFGGMKTFLPQYKTLNLGLYTWGNRKTPFQRSYFSSTAPQKGAQFKSINDSELRQLFNSWDKQIPILVDDGISAYVVLDYNPTTSNVVIGDPHVNHQTSLKGSRPLSTTVYEMSLQEFMDINRRTQYGGLMILFATSSNLPIAAAASGNFNTNSNYNSNINEWNFPNTGSFQTATTNNYYPSFSSIGQSSYIPTSINGFGGYSSTPSNLGGFTNPFIGLVR